MYLDGMLSFIKTRSKNNECRIHDFMPKYPPRKKKVKTISNGVDSDNKLVLE